MHYTDTRGEYIYRGWEVCRRETFPDEPIYWTGSNPNDPDSEDGSVTGDTRFDVRQQIDGILLIAERESFRVTVGPFAYNIAGSRGIWGKHPTEKDSRGNPINVRVGKLSKGEEHLGQIIIDALNKEGA